MNGGQPSSGPVQLDRGSGLQPRVDRRGRTFVVTRLDKPPLASAKAPADVRQVCVSRGMTPLDLQDFDRSTRFTSWWAAGRSGLQLVASAARLATATDVVVQYPLGRTNEIVLARLKHGRRSVCVVHDLEMLRRPAMSKREARTLGQFDVVVAHSEAMADVIRAELPNARIVVLEAFDFLSDASALPASPSPSCLYVFGNLGREKAGYLYGLDAGHSSVGVEAYGVNCDSAHLPQGVRWNGVLDPERPCLGTVSGFGLVWDGDSPSSLSGPFGEYLRYNAPHKFSLYLSLGIPVIVPATAAIAPVVSRYGLGVTVCSVEEGLRVVETCTEGEWRRMLDAVREAQQRVRSGEFVSSALERAGVRDRSVSPALRDCE